MSLETSLSAASVIVAVLGLTVSSFLIIRQAREMEHERNAVALLEATARINDPVILEVFERLEGIAERYPDDAAVRERYPVSRDHSDFQLVASYIETVACLARRRVIDASLIADTLGRVLRRRWLTIAPFVEHLRRLHDNPYILENFEWLALYCAWWKDTPRPSGDRNYDDDQFRGVVITP